MNKRSTDLVHVMYALNDYEVPKIPFFWVYMPVNKQNFPSFVKLMFEKYFIKAIEDFFHVHIAWSKHSWGWENSRQLFKPSTASWVCITVSNSTSSPRVDMRLCNMKKVLYYLSSKLHVN